MTRASSHGSPARSHRAAPIEREPATVVPTRGTRLAVRRRRRGRPWSPDASWPPDGERPAVGRAGSVVGALDDARGGTVPGLKELVPEGGRGYPPTAVRRTRTGRRSPGRWFGSGLSRPASMKP